MLMSQTSDRAATHHNEMIDIATLGKHSSLNDTQGLPFTMHIAAMIPYRRPVNFWAKSTMFKNPISGWILSSAGSIPVNRNPNSIPGENGSQQTDTHHALFKETFQALDDGEVIGVFPEGTSYTEPQIAQVKDGAAWAALEYAKWQRRQETNHKDGSKAKPLRLVPVAIIYTDKSQFQSRVGNLTEVLSRSIVLSLTSTT